MYIECNGNSVGVEILCGGGVGVGGGEVEGCCWWGFGGRRGGFKGGLEDRFERVVVLGGEVEREFSFWGGDEVGVDIDGVVI